jgi:hypothetical protein
MIDRPAKNGFPTTANPESALARWVCAVALALCVVLIGMLAFGASRWIGRTFPGFFLLGNRVVASIAAPGWEVARDGGLYQSVVVAVDGRPVRAANEVYERVSGRPIGQPVRYELRRGTAATEVTLEAATFTARDYAAIFGSYLVTAGLYFVLALLAVAFRFGDPIGRAVLLVGAIGGVYAGSAVGIYDPGADGRIHSVCEALFPAALLQLAVAFRPVATHLERAAVRLGWCVALALAFVYQLVLEQPGAYSAVHAVCESAMGFAGLTLIGVLLIEERQPFLNADPLRRAATVGATLGLGAPGVVMLVSGLSGGAVPVNVATATAFLFPLCLAWQLARSPRRTAQLALGDATPVTG